MELRAHNGRGGVPGWVGEHMRRAVVLLALGLLVPASAADAYVKHRKLVVRPGRATKLRIAVPATSTVQWRIGQLGPPAETSGCTSYWSAGGAKVAVTVNRCARRWVRVRAVGGPARLNLRVTVTRAPARALEPPAPVPAPPVPACSVTQSAAQQQVTAYAMANFAFTTLVPQPKPMPPKPQKSGYGYWGGMGSTTCADLPVAASAADDGVACLPREGPDTLRCWAQYQAPLDATGTRLGISVPLAWPGPARLEPCRVLVQVFAGGPPVAVSGEECFPQWTVDTATGKLVGNV